MQFLGFPIRLDCSQPHYAIDLVNLRGQRLRIDLRIGEEQVEDAGATPIPEPHAESAQESSSSLSASQRIREIRDWLPTYLYGLRWNK